MRGVDGIFHLAGWYQVGVRDKTPGWQINVEGTRNVLEVMRELDIPKGVYTSTLAINSDTHGRVVDESYVFHGPWLSEYERTKWVAHYEVAEPMIRAGLPLVIVEPGAVYGPGDPSPQGQLLRQYLQRKLPMVPRGAALCWAHVEDTAAGHVLAMQRGAVGQSYIIAGPPATIQAVLALAERLTGVPAPRLHPDPRLVKAVAAAMRVVERVVPVPDTYSAEYLRVAAGATYLGSNARARRELGFQPRSLEEGLPETLAYELARLRGALA
jgi:nucleoside-diphosphate-sugar epimerase